MAVWPKGCVTIPTSNLKTQKIKKTQFFHEYSSKPKWQCTRKVHRHSSLQLKDTENKETKMLPLFSSKAQMAMWPTKVLHHPNLQFEDTKNPEDWVAPTILFGHKKRCWEEKLIQMKWEMPKMTKREKEPMKRKQY